MAPALIKNDGSIIAYHQVAATKKAPGVVFLGGFRSDMTGTKATYLETLCQQLGCSYVRFDYFGHGQSSGKFAEGTLGRWLEDALTVLDELTQGPQILVGSSMGGWLMLLVALQRRERIRGLVGIAAAPDFIDDFERLSLEQHRRLNTEGVCYIASSSGEAYPLTLAFIEEGRKHRVLPGAIPIDCPVHLLHGLADKEVPWQKSILLAERLLSKEVTITLVKDGNHRLAEEKQLKLLGESVKRLLG